MCQTLNQALRRSRDLEQQTALLELLFNEGSGQQTNEQINNIISDKCDVGKIKGGCGVVR